MVSGTTAWGSGSLEKAESTAVHGVLGVRSLVNCSTLEAAIAGALGWHCFIMWRMQSDG
ncbi:MAG: hypothetical protein F6K42_21770 [Leptolyngbya sp. SIO1D8]|nr:hypothetical protein [Leptolyngbya sp. SIO1D8]